MRWRGIMDAAVGEARVQRGPNQRTTYGRPEDVPCYWQRKVAEYSPVLVENWHRGASNDE